MDKVQYATGEGLRWQGDGVLYLYDPESLYNDFDRYGLDADLHADECECEFCNEDEDEDEAAQASIGAQS